MKTVLLTAVGSASAAAALQSLRALGCRVVGCDIYPREWNHVSTEVDAFFQALPVTDEAAYVAQLMDAVQREGVDWLIPLTDVEVDVLCACKDRFAVLGCTVCVPDEPVTRLCRNKLRMAQALADVCRTIPTFVPYDGCADAFDYPLMLKPQSGRSSQGQRVVHDAAACRAALAVRDDLIAQPFICGDVFTVDVARDRFGNVQALARRELLRTVNGLGTTVRVLPDHPLEQVCADIAQAVQLVGVVNMEFIVNRDGAYFLEVNPRFSGGIGFSCAAGLDLPALQLQCFEGKAIGPRPALRPVTVTRRISPIITEF